MVKLVPDALCENGDSTSASRAVIGKAGDQPFDAADIRIEALGDDQTFGWHALRLGLFSNQLAEAVIDGGVFRIKPVKRTPLLRPPVRGPPRGGASSPTIFGHIRKTELKLHNLKDSGSDR